MIINFIYFILALLGLGFLIFIHELGHYYMARKVGMKIEVFSIGLGKPIYSWMFQGVKWQLSWLPFGGYVKIAGEKEEAPAIGKEPAENTFYGKNPFARIKVALAGPIVNIVFAFLLFTIIWALGGKFESFAKNTNLIGYMDPSSELYAKGVRPGDQIVKYNGETFSGFRDLLYASVVKQDTLTIQGNKIDYFDQKEDPFDYVLIPYSDPRGKADEFKTVGVLTPASMLIFNKPEASSDFPFDESPMKDSGISYGDRIVWANGEMIFSMPQLNKIVNESKTMLTVTRNGQQLLVKVPRLKIGDLRIDRYEKAEFEDWQHQINKRGAVKDLFFIPYRLDKQGVVKDVISYIGEDSEQHTVYDQNDIADVLKAGDRIVAVDGSPVRNGYAFFEAIQVKKVKLIVQRGFSQKDLTWKNQNERLIKSINGQDLSQAVKSIMGDKQNDHFGDLYVLKGVEPILLSDLPLSSEKKNWLVKEFVGAQERIGKIKDQQARTNALKSLEKSRQKLVLGLPLSDALVQYNPNPAAIFSQVVGETFKTLTSLVTGKIHPKWMSGPIGMVQIIHHGWTVGIKEALFWMATISLNLGVFNLLPLPVLDGGHICFALYESITRKRLHPKMMEKLVIPFIVALIGLFIYVTYQDVMRLFSNFF